MRVLNPPFGWFSPLQACGRVSACLWPPAKPLDDQWPLTYLVILVPGQILGGQHKPILLGAPLHDTDVVDGQPALPDDLEGGGGRKSVDRGQDSPWRMGWAKRDPQKLTPPPALQGLAGQRGWGPDLPWFEPQVNREEGRGQLRIKSLLTEPSE